MEINTNKKTIIKNNSLSKNAFMSGICKPLSMIIGYIYVPIALNYLGVEKYGIWATILTFLSWISYFDIGVGNGLRNKLTEAITEKSYDKGKKLVSSAYAFITIVMIGVIIVFCAFASFADWNRIFGVRNYAENLKIIVCISVIFVAVNFILSICKNVLYALQKAANVSVMQLVSQILNLCGVLVVKQIMPGNLFCMALIYGLSMTITNLLFSLLLYLKHKSLTPGIKFVDIKEGKDLTNLGFQFFVIQICALILFTTDSLIISYLYGAADVTPYSTVNKLFLAISGIYTAFLAPVWTATTKAKVEQQWDYLLGFIKKYLLFMAPFVTLALVLIFIFRPVASWWLGQELYYTYGLIPLGACYCILTIWCNLFSNVANGLELMKMSITTAIIQAVVNIPMSLYFAQICEMGSAGVLYGTVLAMLISAIVQPIAVFRYINKNRKMDVI